MNKTKCFLLAVAVAAMVFTLSCSSDDGNDDDGGGGSSSSVGGSSSPSGSSGGCPNPSVSGNSLSCGGKTYKIVQIGEQTWMAENLNYYVEGSKCYNNDPDGPDNCAEYGRLYSFSKAKTVCPSGWHLPSQAEWKVMTAFIGGEDTEGKKLKATSGWNNNGNGMDDYGFSAHPGGEGFYAPPYDNSFENAGRIGNWWISNDGYHGDNYFYRSMFYDSEYARSYSANGAFLYSVRCIQNSSSCTANDNTNTHYCSNGTMKKYGSVTDQGNKTYKTVVIGEQTWMAENLNYDVPNNATDVCYGNTPANCTKYGRLYDWETANTVCPTGWHLPSNAEWTALTDYVGSIGSAGTVLKSATDWSTVTGGIYINYYGFSALPGGIGFSDGDFYDAGDFGFWWSSTEYGSEQGMRTAYSQIISNENGSAGWNNYNKDYYLFSVRCVQ